MNAADSLPASALLTVEALGCTRAQRSILRDIAFDIHPGEWVALVGCNGAGKSTLLQAAAQLIPSTGRVYLQQQNIAHYSVRARAQRIAWLAQQSDSHALDEMLVRSIVELARIPQRGWWQSFTTEDADAIDHALQTFDITHLAQRRFGQLSGGEQRRVLLARAWAVEADCLLLDEPLAHLDPQHQAQCLRAIRNYTHSGRSVLSAVHEINAALHADRIILLGDGIIQYQGRSSDAQTHRALEQLFAPALRIDAVSAGENHVKHPIRFVATLRL